ncbi:MAG: hypothetical protein IJE05_02235 [Clostridia bacterium]|nr:hypothetical protein [Clostridia bacterium]
MKTTRRTTRKMAIIAAVVAVCFASIIGAYAVMHNNHGGVKELGLTETGEIVILYNDGFLGKTTFENYHGGVKATGVTKTGETVTLYNDGLIIKK